MANWVIFTAMIVLEKLRNELNNIETRKSLSKQIATKTGLQIS